MEPVPISRSALQQLKATTDEENRQKSITGVVQRLYMAVLNKAKCSSETSLKFQLYKTDFSIRGVHLMVNDPLNNHEMNLILDNQEDVIQKLRVLFPGSTITISSLCRAADGNFYNTSTLDENLLKFVDRRYDQTCLVVDWS